MRWTFRTLMLAGGVAGASLATIPVAAQTLELHGTGSVQTDNQSTSWGGGLAIGRSFLPAGLAVIGASLGADYIREQHLGKGLASTSLAISLSPPNTNARFVPYVGGALSLNWSGGQYAQWTGARVGLDGTLGIRALFGSADRFGWMAEERYGYIRGFDHAYATRLGLLFGL